MELDMTAAMVTAQKERYLAKSWVGRKIEGRMTHLLRFCKADIMKRVEEKTFYYKNTVYFGQGCSVGRHGDPMQDQSVK